MEAIQNCSSLCEDCQKIDLKSVLNTAQAHRFTHPKSGGCISPSYYDYSVVRNASISFHNPRIHSQACPLCAFMFDAVFRDGGPESRRPASIEMALALPQLTRFDYYYILPHEYDFLWNEDGFHEHNASPGDLPDFANTMEIVRLKPGQIINSNHLAHRGEELGQGVGIAAEPG